ncbi:MAG: hypothetical protein KGQ37_00395 [Hyphomicrobiales bacterium]|nr:hypothetical protein [Hyphomicrobiales bacterium]
MMTAAALSDFVLALAAFAVAGRWGRGRPALQIGSLLTAVAALVGAITYAGLLPLYGLHDALSLIAAVSGLPMLALGLTWPQSATARRAPFAWGLALAAAALGLVVVGLHGPKALLEGVAVVSMLVILLAGALRLDRPRQITGLLLLLGAATFRLGVHAGASVPPVAMLHIFMAGAFLVMLRIVAYGP